MKKQTFAVLLLALLLAAADGQTARAETTPGLVNLLVVVPGMTRSVDIRQDALLPLGCPQFFIFVLGSGTLGISVVKDDTAGDTIFMMGFAASSAGTFPLYRAGISKGMIDQIVEIGDDRQPYGFIWLWCGVALSNNTPGYNVGLRVSLAP